MKLAFSTRHIKMKSFLDLCNIAADYSFSAFEIYDSLAEAENHSDSIFRSDCTSGAKRKLMNRKISVCAVSYPTPLDDEKADIESLIQQTELASAAGIDQIIFSVMSKDNFDSVISKVKAVLPVAERKGITVLFETKNDLADTENALFLLKALSSPSTGIAWNIRDTFFGAGESAATTIKTLGAYICYVRIGDMKDGRSVLPGEGELEVKSFLDALKSLNYDGYVCACGNDEIKDPDIVLTHFSEYIGSLDKKKKKTVSLQQNRAGTGTFPWKKYEVIDKTFPDVLDTMAETYPDQYAFRYTTLDYTRTYSEFREDVDRVAASLIALGVKPGYHVAIWATNIPQWFLAFWASCRIGAVLVTVNTGYRIHETEYLLRQSDTHTLIMIESCKDIVYSDIIRELCPELRNRKKGEQLYSEKLPFLRNIVTVGFEMEGGISWKEMLSLGARVPREEVIRRSSLVKPDDVCNMQYTSGTTGFPKGVMLTHKNIINNGKIIGDRMDLSTADRMMIQVPMFHCFGMVLSMTSMMTHGGTLSPLPYFSPKSSLACINQEKITCFNGVPTMYIAMFGHENFKKTDFSYMRTGIMAGSNCPPELMKRAADEMNMKEILSVYGQTESSPGCTMGEVNESLERRCETVGTAFPGVECKIIDPETGKDLPDGQSGEFVARGFNIMKGYYKMPEATSQAIDAGGWLHTGDICMRDHEGYFKVTGRLKDMIIRGGENIYPREIEEFYLTNPSVKDAQVVGVADEKYGEEACCWIILHKGESKTEEEMKQFGREHIAAHKVPRYFIFTDEFPMNAAGKILKYKMKEESEKIIHEKN